MTEAHLNSSVSSAPRRSAHEGFNRFLAHFFPLFWTITPAAVLRLLPGSSRHYGPPRRTARWVNTRWQRDSSWRQVFDREVEKLPPPFFCSDPNHALSKGIEVVWPETGVAEIRAGRLLDEHAWTVGERDTFLEDFSYNGHHRQCHVRRILKLHRPRHLPGRTLNLCSAHAAINFFHFTIDAISRWDLLQRAGYGWADFDRVVVPRFESPMAGRILQAINLPPEKAVALNRREQVECELLVQPSFPGPLGCIPGWVVDFYRRLFPVPATAPRTRRVYLARRGNRQPKNDDVLGERLLQRGFERVDPMRDDLPEILGTASHVVGTHGASFANLVFCRPGTRVLELMPSEMAAHHNGLFYSTLCASGDMPYGVVIGQSATHRLTPYSPQNKAPFDLSLDAFDRGLNALLA